LSFSTTLKENRALSRALLPPRLREAIFANLSSKEAKLFTLSMHLPHRFSTALRTLAQPWSHCARYLLRIYNHTNQISILISIIRYNSRHKKFF